MSVLIAIFLNRLLDLGRRKLRLIPFAGIALILFVQSLIFLTDTNSATHTSAGYVLGSVAVILVAVYTFGVALAEARHLQEPIAMGNRFFIALGPLYILYLMAYTLFPFLTGSVLRTGPLSFTNISYGIWSVIFLWFLIRFMTEKPASDGQPPSIQKQFLDSHDFTDREREIIGLVLDGHGNKQIAHTLEINESTVKAHLYKAYAKLGIHTRVELVRSAFDLGTKPGPPGN